MEWTRLPLAVFAAKALVRDEAEVARYLAGGPVPRIVREHCKKLLNGWRCSPGQVPS